jgi:hypothetical protein
MHPLHAAVSQESSSVDDEAYACPTASEILQETAQFGSTLDLELATLPTSSDTDIFDFDLTAGTAPLESLSAMMDDVTNGEDQMALASIGHSNETCSTAYISSFAKSRIGWSVNELKLVPTMMIEQNGTPWQHPMLYEEYMPKSLQDAYAACALHIARNGVNDVYIARFVIGRMQELVATPLPQQAVGLLGRAHALMLYQIILVFSGDIKLYGQAELLLPHMDDVGDALLTFAAQQTDPTAPLPLYPSAIACGAWNAYIFRESLRRTVLSLYHLVTTCYLLRGQPSRCKNHLIVGNKVTISAHLWHARNAFEFAIAWNEKRYFLIRELDFAMVMEDARPDDLDTFSKMIMIGMKGIDDIRGWLYTKGGNI